MVGKNFVAKYFSTALPFIVKMPLRFVADSAEINSLVRFHHLTAPNEGGGGGILNIPWNFISYPKRQLEKTKILV